ncbi:MAG: hypothetical protein JW760_08845 [Spirochaetales bacterium]|nr:hypothetical protein [Spirochaetales bacterium]
MPGFLISTFGFFLLILSDYLQGKGFLWISRLFSALGYLAVGYLLFLMLSFRGDDLFRGSRLIGGILTLLFCVFLLYSVIIEVNLLPRRYGLQPGEALMRGTYGICRHPGFWWFFLLMPSLYLLHGDRNLLLLSGYMTLLNFLLVFLEDRFLFPAIFSNYKEYRERVPFLFPRFRPRTPGGRKK